MENPGGKKKKKKEIDNYIEAFHSSCRVALSKWRAPGARGRGGRLVHNPWPGLTKQHVIHLINNMSGAEEGVCTS